MNLYFKSTTLDKEIGWTWKDMDKAYWDTWIPKKSDIKIITRLNKEQKKEGRGDKGRGEGGGDFEEGGRGVGGEEE